MMTPERAQYILDNTLFGEFRFSFRQPHDYSAKRYHTDGITPEEDAYIRKVWDAIPSGSSTYHEAVVRIARGLLPKP